MVLLAELLHFSCEKITIVAKRERGKSECYFLSFSKGLNMDSTRKKYCQILNDHRLKQKSTSCYFCFSFVLWKGRAPALLIVTAKHLCFLKKKDREAIFCQTRQRYDDFIIEVIYNNVKLLWFHLILLIRCFNQNGYMIVLFSALVPGYHFRVS